MIIGANTIMVGIIIYCLFAVVISVALALMNAYKGGDGKDVRDRR